MKKKDVIVGSTLPVIKKPRKPTKGKVTTKDLAIRHTSILGIVIVNERSPFSQIALNSVGQTAPILT